MKLQFLPPGALRLHGPLGKALDKVIANRLRQLDYGMLTAIFRDHSEKDDKWRCEFWGKVVRSAVYAWRGTGDAELKKIIDIKHGEIHLRIEEVLQEKGISKNKICKDLNIPRYNFNRYCKNEIQFLDTDFLSRLCCYLQIGIQDLFVYLPTKS